MPPALALFLCTIFVILLLRMERKQNPAASSALWVPTIWVLLIASRSACRWFGIYGESIESGNPLDQAVLLVLLFAAFFILAGRRFDWGGVFRENTWLMLLIGFEFLSIGWSDIPFISFKRWIRDIMVVPMAFVILSEEYPRQALQSIFRRTLYILIPFSEVLIKYFPAYGVQYGRWSGGQMWTGVALEKNGLGRLCLISAFFLIWVLFRRWKKCDIPVVKYQTHIEVFLLLTTLWLSKGPGSYSATSVGCLAFGLVVLAGFSMLRKRGVYLSTAITSVVVIGIIVIGTLTPFLHGGTLSSWAPVLGRDETFTDRTEIWDRLLPRAMQRPIVGHGVGGFWTTQTVGLAEVNEAHNGYLEVLIDYGFAGLVLITVFLLSCCRKAHRELTIDYDWGAFWICLLLMFLLYNITESSLDWFSAHFAAIIIFLTFCSGGAVAKSPERVAPAGYHGAWVLRRP